MLSPVTGSPDLWPIPQKFVFPVVWNTHLVESRSGTSSQKPYRLLLPFFTTWNRFNDHPDYRQHGIDPASVRTYRGVWTNVRFMTRA